MSQTIDLKHNHAGDSPEMAFDPVCGMTVKKATAPATRDFEGERFYFCMARCAQSFAADPKKYLVKSTRSS